MQWRLARWRELAALHALDRAERMVRNGHDLKAERQHVPIQPGLDNLARIRVVVPEMVKTALQKARDAPAFAERTPRSNHRVKSPSLNLPLSLVIVGVGRQSKESGAVPTIRNPIGLKRLEQGKRLEPSNGGRSTTVFHPTRPSARVAVNGSLGVEHMVSTCALRDIVYVTSAWCSHARTQSRVTFQNAEHLDAV
jgi:hypothetical protein